MELIFLCSVNFIRGVVEGEGLVRLVQLCVAGYISGNTFVTARPTVYT